MAERTFRDQMDLVGAATGKPFAANIPIGVDHTEGVLASSREHLRYVIEPRRANPALASQLRVVTTSGGPPDAFTSIIKGA